MNTIISNRPRVLPDQRFGRWTVCGHAFRIRLFGLSKPTIKELVVAQCDCGTIATTPTKALVSGESKSCGCLQKQIAASTMSKTMREHGMSHTRLHDIWSNMLQRCGNPNDPAYIHYGERGIFVCTDWLDFMAFKAWSEANGYRADLTLDRIDNDLGYSPENCRWTTQLVQSNNTRKNIFVSAFGETRTVKQWSRDPRCKVKYEGLLVRIKKLGWDAERAITAPKQGAR